MEQPADARLRIEVVYATPREQVVLALTVAEGACVGDAIEQSGIIARFPELEPSRTPVGIYGRRVDRDALLHDGDRVEIYRPLSIDPKEARRVRTRGRSRFTK